MEETEACTYTHCITATVGGRKEGCNSKMHAKCQLACASDVDLARAGIERKQEWHDTARQKQEHRTRQKGRSSREFTLVLSGMIIQHTPPPDTAVELCMPCQALSK